MQEKSYVVQIEQIYIFDISWLLSTNCFGQLQGREGKSPLDELPGHIRRVTHFGQRADFSHDGKRILFIEKTFGDVYEVELKTKIIRPMTHRYFHEGYTRALYLANGDILLSGARQFDANDPWPSRSEKNAELWVLKNDLSRPPTPLGEKCSEGPAVSRKHMRIAWTQQGAFYLADIVYKNGIPELANKKKILDKNYNDIICRSVTYTKMPIIVLQFKNECVFIEFEPVIKIKNQEVFPFISLNEDSKFFYISFYLFTNYTIKEKQYPWLGHGKKQTKKLKLEIGDSFNFNLKTTLTKNCE